MVYAQIRNQVVVNTIVLDDPTILHLFKVGFDDCVRVDQLSPQPGIGWSYSLGNGFSPPVQDS